MILYKRNAKGEPQYWSIQEGFKGNILLDYGIVGCNGHQESIPKKLVKANEVESRVKAKRKEGYKQLCELKDSGPDKILDTIGLINYLNTYLPKNNTTSDGFILPMLAKVLKDNKPFLKTPFLGQYKINGVRCIISAQKLMICLNLLNLYIILEKELFGINLVGWMILFFQIYMMN